MHYWAAHQFDELSSPIPGREEPSGWYLIQKKQLIKAPFGREILLTSYLFQSLDKIARPVDIYSKKHRQFWVARSTKDQSGPNGPDLPYLREKLVNDMHDLRTGKGMRSCFEGQDQVYHRGITGR